MTTTSSTPLERRKRYLDAAQRLFSEHGYAATSMDMVVAAVGGSKATLYRYFPSKEALIEGLTLRLADRVAGTRPNRELYDLDLEEALRRIGGAVLDAAFSDQGIALLRLSLGEYNRFPQLARTLWENGPAISYGNFREFLAHKQAQGQVVEADTQLAAEHFLAGLVGHRQLKIAMGMSEPPDAEEAARMLEASVQAFIARYAV